MELQNWMGAALLAAAALSCGGMKDGADVPRGAALDALAEMERTGGYRPGLGIRESGIREQHGDHGGAVFAAFKDLLWAYSFNHPELNRQAIRDGLSNVRALYTTKGLKKASRRERREAIRAVDASLFFLDERYADAHKILKKEDFSGEPDSFGRWMALAASLESGGASQAEMAAYGAIRARYEAFPAYWYHGARTLPAHLAGEYAERCVNAAPDGRYADEARALLAECAGLNRADGPALRSRLEIEQLLTRAVAERNPSLLSPLLALITLDDNPWTLFARGALRSLAAEPAFKAWLNEQEAAAENGGAAQTRLALTLRALIQG